MVAKLLKPRRRPARRKSPPRLRLAPADRRAQIIAEAIVLLSTRPFSQFAVADVAKRARITQSLVYHYFPTKEALLAAAFSVRAHDLLIASRPDPALPYPAQVEKSMRGYLDFVEENRIGYLNFVRGPAAGEPTIARICEEMRLETISRFLAVLDPTGKKLAVTRASLRGYVGYAEALILDWLDHRRMSRATLERLLYSVITSSLCQGLRLDPESPLDARQIDAVEAAYRSHFGLPAPIPA